MRADLAKARLLFWTFFKIGAFTFGGGYAMIPLIQREVAERRHWMEDSDILDIVAIAESTPGPIAINSATFVGYQVCGTFGAFCATLGVVLPSFLVIYAISFVLRQFSHLLVVQYAFNGIRAGVLALLLKALLSMYRQSPKGAVAYAVMAGAFVLTAFLDVDAVAVILLCAAVGLLTSLRGKRRGRVMVCLELFVTFFKIGLFTIGGGYAMLPLIQEEVQSNGWMTAQELVNFIAVSESTPGPFAVNVSTYVGAELAGLPGALCATLGVVLPSFLIILLVARCYAAFRSSAIVSGVMGGLRPAVIGMIAAAVVSVGATVFLPDGVQAVSAVSLGCSLAIFGGMTVLTFKKVHPIVIILLSALLGIAAGYLLPV